MIPSLVDLGSPTPWAVLPPGVHVTSMPEIEARFATTPHRRWLYGGFRRAADALASAGCMGVYLDGSFVTDKPHPDDFDGCWEIEGVDLSRLDPILLDFRQKRAAQKAKFFGEMFMAEGLGVPGLTFVEFFQIEKFSGRSKGILRVPLAPSKGPSA